MYALRHKETGKLMGFSISGNFGIYSLDEGNQVWTNPNKNHAHFVSISTVDWYKSNYNSPVNDYVGKLEVVELVITPLT